MPANVLTIIIEEALPSLSLLDQSLSTGSVAGVKFSVIGPLLKKFGSDSDEKLYICKQPGIL